MQPTIKAIETKYKGYRFRSRLEARWAVFFDKLGVRYEYEKEGYDLGKYGWYLPDFWLPEQKLWVEIKGDVPTHEEAERLGTLIDAMGNRGVIFHGEIRIPNADWATVGSDEWREMWQECDWMFVSRALGTGWQQSGILIGVRWHECPICHGIDLFSCCDMDGDASWMHPECLIKYLRGQTNKPYHGYYNNRLFKNADKTPRIMAAYEAARSARFEHGETP